MQGGNMNNKIQMTEEQARKFFMDIFSDCFDREAETDHVLKITKEKGYIIKSELQQKVEEAERMYLKIQSEREFNDLEVVLIRAFRELKQSHPEFKK